MSEMTDEFRRYYRTLPSHVQSRKLAEYLNQAIAEIEQLESENAKLREVKWYTWNQVSRDIHDGDIWWHDDGEQVLPVNIMWCPTGNYFFASLGQWGWTRSQKLEEMSGLWTPCLEPARKVVGDESVIRHSSRS